MCGFLKVDCMYREHTAVAWGFIHFVKIECNISQCIQIKYSIQKNVSYCGMLS
jgi:hypothetical protein